MHDARPALVNGAVGWVSVLDGEVYAIGALTLQNGRITTMDILLDPARLARLDLTDFGSRLWRDSNRPNCPSRTSI